MPYEDSDNKRAVRGSWDRPILQARLAQLGRVLFYFGLTGPEMKDVLDWRDLLSDKVTSVEEPGKRYNDILSRMYDVATANGIDFELMHATVEYVIANGADIDNARPRRVTVVDGELRFAYDVVNLDFDGGLGSALARHRSVERLLVCQNRTAFTLLVTYNVRHQVHRAVAQELENLRGQLGADDAVIDWYTAAVQPESLRVKAVVPSLVAHAASAAHLDCRAYPPVRYLGHERATMVHFVFDLTPRPDAFRGHTAGALDLVTLPLIDVVGGELRISEQQDPLFVFERCSNELAFLPADVRDAMLARHEH